MALFFSPHPINYILVDGKPVPECNMLKWSYWMAANKPYKVTKIGGVQVSTIFLGIDQNYGGSVPILFETIVFRGGKSNEQERYMTWAEAEKGHDEIVAKVRREIREKVNE